MRWAVRAQGWRPSRSEWSHAVELLPGIDAERVESFHHFDDARRALIGQLLVRRLGQSWGFDPSKDVVRSGEGGRPRVLTPKYDFNVAHDGSWVVLSAVGSGGHHTGVDVVRTARVSSVERLRGVFTEREKRDIETCADARAARAMRLMLWCAKEAVLKTLGVGVAYGMSNVDISLPVAARNACAGCSTALDDGFDPHKSKKPTLEAYLSTAPSEAVYDENVLIAPTSSWSISDVKFARNEEWPDYFDSAMSVEWNLDMGILDEEHVWAVAVSGPRSNDMDQTPASWHSVDMKVGAPFQFATVPIRDLVTA